MWRASLVIVAVLVCPVVASGQAAATATADAPIYVNPRITTPLRVAAVGTVLRVVGQDEGWLQVLFQDPQWGQRTGWVQRAHVSVSDPLKPMDLSTRDTPATAPAFQREGIDAARSSEPWSPAPESRQPGSVPAAAIGRPQTREGLWFNVGLGYGTQGCLDCVLRDSGLSGGLSLGGRISDRVLLGVGTAGWAKEIDGETASVGTLDARVRFYPARTSGFFLTGGLGIGTSATVPSRKSVSAPFWAWDGIFGSVAT